MRIGVLQRHIVERAGVHLRQVAQRLFGRGPLVGMHGRILQGALLPGRTQLPDPVFEDRRTRSLCHCLCLLGIRLEETGVQVVVQWNIQRIHPDCRLIRLAAVIVPQPGGGQDKVAPFQEHAIPLHRTPGAAAVDDEAHRLGGVPMGGGDLVPVEPLDCRPKGGRRERLALQTGIGERDGPAVAATFHRHQASCALGHVVQIGPLPQPGERNGPRLW